jgi:hypothetical protein
MLTSSDRMGILIVGVVVEDGFPQTTGIYHTAHSIPFLSGMGVIF